MRARVLAVGGLLCLSHPDRRTDAEETSQRKTSLPAPQGKTLTVEGYAQDKPSLAQASAGIRRGHAEMLPKRQGTLPCGQRAGDLAARRDFRVGKERGLQARGHPAPASSEPRSVWTTSECMHAYVTVVTVAYGVVNVCVPWGIVFG